MLAVLFLKWNVQYILYLNLVRWLVELDKWDVKENCWFLMKVLILKKSQIEFRDYTVEDFLSFIKFLNL